MPTFEQRKKYVLASNILLVGLVVTWLILIVRRITGIAFPQPTRWPYLIHVVSIVLFLLMAALYYAVRSGKRWSRVLLLVLVVGTTWLNLASAQKIKSDPLNVLSFVVYYFTHIWGLILLFRRPELQRIN